MSARLKSTKCPVQKMFKILTNTSTGVLILECFSPSNFPITLCCQKIDVTMRKGVPLMLTSLEVFCESQLSALPFVMLVLLQSQNCSFYCRVQIAAEWHLHRLIWEWFSFALASKAHVGQISVGQQTWECESSVTSSDTAFWLDAELSGVHLQPATEAWSPAAAHPFSPSSSP